MYIYYYQTPSGFSHYENIFLERKTTPARGAKKDITNNNGSGTPHFLHLFIILPPTLRLHLFADIDAFTPASGDKPQPNKQQPPQQQTTKRKDGAGTNGCPIKKPKVAAKGESAAKEEEKRVNNNKLAWGSTARAAETEEKVRRNSGGSPKEKQLASTTTRKTANWSDKFKKPPPGKSPAHRRWTKKACCGHGGDIPKSNWYYGVEGLNDSWQLFLCTECFGKIMEDIKSKGKDVEKDLDYKPICNGKEVSFKRGQEGGTLQKMSLSDFNKIEPK